MIEQEPGAHMPGDEHPHSTNEPTGNPIEFQPHQTVEARLSQLIDTLANQYDQPGFDLVAESYLSRLGVREPLRASGILPQEDPNPHDIDSEPEAYAQWWDEHTDIDPWQTQQQYEETLKVLYIGARIGFLAGKLLDRVPLRRIDNNESANDS